MAGGEHEGAVGKPPSGTQGEAAEETGAAVRLSGLEGFNALNSGGLGRAFFRPSGSKERRTILPAAAAGVSVFSGERRTKALPRAKRQGTRKKEKVQRVKPCAGSLAPGDSRPAAAEKFNALNQRQTWRAAAAPFGTTSLRFPGRAGSGGGGFGGCGDRCRAARRSLESEDLPGPPEERVARIDTDHRGWQSVCRAGGHRGEAGDRRRPGGPGRAEGRVPSQVDQPKGG